MLPLLVVLFTSNVVACDLWVYFLIDCLVVTDPPITDAENASGAGRLLGHEDVTFITLLPAPDQEGLQILHRATRKWIRVRGKWCKNGSSEGLLMLCLHV